MLALIIKSYLTLFLSIGFSSLFIFILGLYWIFKFTSTPLDNNSDLTSIAGDDIIATQLDLARAYIETNNKQTAKQVLKSVIRQGSKTQKAEAKILLGSI
jgi:FimV-like protein